MYIIKNALRNVWRSKGRSVLMGIIVLVVALAVCVSLTIQQAAKNAQESTLDGMTVTASISVDRAAMMESSNTEEGEFDKSAFQDQMSEGLSLEEMETYAAADSVKSFYYSATTSVNGSDALEAVTDSDSSSSEETTDETSAEEGGFMAGAEGGMGGSDQGMSGGMGGGRAMEMAATMGDFSLIGYSSDEAMTAFVNGTNSITEGSVFAEGNTDMECIISEELALYNSISVGDTITVTNPTVDTETYELTVVGIYTSSESEMGGFSMIDPANQILMSYDSLVAITDSSAANATTVTNEVTGNEESSELTATTSGTYVFATVEDYEKFEDEARDLGLADTYTISSTDYTNYTESLVPLQTLSKLSQYFLIVILIIGVIILMVFNMFSTRERKYEIGVLTAIGMKKTKVAMQFMMEIFAITIAAVVIGGVAGSVASVPIANSLLESQVAAQEESAASTEQSFGRGMNGGPGGDMQAPSESSSSSDNESAPADAPGMTRYVSEISSSVNIIVLLEVLGICILVSLIAGVVSVSTIMKYEPLTILAGRD